MIIQGKRCPIYFQSKNRKIRLWHQQIEYVSNAKIVKVSRMLETIIVDNDNIIIDNNFNSFIDSLNNKSLENEKRN